MTDLLDQAPDVDPGDPGEPAEPGRPDDATIRAELRDRGHDPPARARLGQEWVKLWLSGETAGDPGDQPAPEGVTAAGPPPAAEPQRPSRAGAGTGERKPRRPKPSGGLRERLWGPKTDPPKDGKKRSSNRSSKRTDKPTHARVPIDRICSQIWGGVGRAFEDLDEAVARCLDYQAGLAGVVAEDTFRGTIVDRVLQPAARGEDKFRKITGLAGLPILILAYRHALTLPPPQRAFRTAVLTPMLREAAAQMIRLSGENAERMAEREAENAAVMEEADALLQMILVGPVTPPSSAPPAGPGAAEDQAAAAAQQPPGGFMFTAPQAPPPEPPPSPYAHPYATPPRRRVIPGQLLP